MKQSHMLVLSMLVPVLVGCAANPGGNDDRATRRSSNQISMEEVQQAQAQNAYDLIRSLRPHWLQPRGQHSLSNPAAGQVVIYVDGTRTGGAALLQQILSSDVQSAQYLSATEASARFGLDHTGGAILITTRR